MRLQFDSSQSWQAVEFDVQGVMRTRPLSPYLADDQLAFKSVAIIESEEEISWNFASS